MRIWTGHTQLHFRLLGFFVVDGEIRSEGYNRPAPSTESKLGFSLTFDEAQELRDDLDKALRLMPCPHCKRTVP